MVTRDKRGIGTAHLAGLSLDSGFAIWNSAFGLENAEFLGQANLIDLFGRLR
jgi:hypothetical protein